VEICWTLGKIATETYEMLTIAYCNEATFHTCLLECFKSFIMGHENHTADPRSGQPSTVQNPERVGKVNELLTRDQ
jgi:hypothetical protein